MLSAAISETIEMVRRNGQDKHGEYRKQRGAASIAKRLEAFMDKNLQKHTKE